MNKDDFEYDLKLEGYQIFDQGSTSTILKKPGHNQIIKISTSQNISYYEYCAKTINPHLPVIHELKKYDGWYWYKSNLMEENSIKNDAITRLFCEYETTEKLIQSFNNLTEKEYCNSLLETFLSLISFKDENDLEFDLHKANFMMYQNNLVFNDPFV